MYDGDLVEGELQIGQAAGAIRDLPAAGDLVGAIARDCERIIAEMPGRLLRNQ